MEVMSRLPSAIRLSWVTPKIQDLELTFLTNQRRKKMLMEKRDARLNRTGTIN